MHVALDSHILMTINMIEDGEVTPFIVVTGHGMDISDRANPPYVNLVTKNVNLYMMGEPGLFIENRADAITSLNWKREMCEASKTTYPLHSFMSVVEENVSAHSLPIQFRGENCPNTLYVFDEIQGSAPIRPFIAISDMDQDDEDLINVRQENVMDLETLIDRINETSQVADIRERIGPDIEIPIVLVACREILDEEKVELMKDGDTWSKGYDTASKIRYYL